MFHVTLASGHSVLTLLAVAVGAIALAGVFYHRARRQLTPGRWAVLLALRGLAILLVVLLLFRPVFSYQRDVEQRRSVVFVVDSSASMATTDDGTGTPRFDQARTRVFDWWKKLERDFDLHLLDFSDQASPLREPADLAAIQPKGPATSLVRALQAAGQGVRRRDLEAVVLLSDGIHNAAGDPVETARKLGVTVHTVGVGNSLRDSPSYRDLQVIGMECPPQLPVNNTARVTALIDAVGLGGRVTTAVLEEDGKPVAKAELTLDDVEGGQEVRFEFLPTAKGRHLYTVRVPVAPGEKIVENNHRSLAAQVVDVRMRVLYVEGTLRAEYGALVDRFLSKDPDLEFCALVQTRPNVFVQRSNIAALQLTGIPSDQALIDSFDVFILGDVDSTYLKPPQMAAIRKRVEGGAGLIMLGGYHSLGPGGYQNTPIGELLPVHVGGRDIGQVSETFLPTLTPEGVNHPIFANIVGFFPTRTGPPATPGLPPLSGCVRVQGAKPGATVLAVYQDEKGGAPMPVLATQPAGKGRVAVFSADTTRGWHQVLRGLDQQSPFIRFWGQTVRWLANRTDAVRSGISARADRAHYDPGATVTVTATVRDKDGEGTSKAAVSAVVTGAGGTAETVGLMPGSGGAGHYAGTFEPTASGSYEIVVSARLGDATLTADKLVIEVGRPNLEFDRLHLNDKLLGRIAAATGGRYVHLSTADRLIDEFDRKEQRRRVYLEQPLYSPPIYWLLFVGLLTGEWLLRRRFQLR